MKSMIKEIYYGNICDENIKMSELMREHYSKLSDMQDDLKVRLLAEHYELVVKLIDAIEFKNCDQVAQHYAEGFKVGILIGIECADKD